MVTLAPSAYKMTWAEIIHRVPDATLVRTLGDNTFEALYIVNILDQVCRNCLCFATDPPCRSPLRVFDAPTGSSCIRAWAYRVEFQEGEHMHQPSYVHGSYHGTDVQRAHLCLWCTEGRPPEFPASHRAVFRIRHHNNPNRQACRLHLKVGGTETRCISNIHQKMRPLGFLQVRRLWVFRKFAILTFLTFVARVTSPSTSPKLEVTSPRTIRGCPGRGLRMQNQDSSRHWTCSRGPDLRQLK